MNAIKLIVLFTIVFTNIIVSTAQTFDIADPINYQLKIIKEYNDTIKCYGTSQYADSNFIKDGIWLIYSNDDTSKILEVVSILNKKKNGLSKVFFSEKSYLLIWYYDNSIKSRSFVVHKEELPNNKDYRDYFLIIYNGFLSYYENNILKVCIIFERNIPFVSYYYNDNGSLNSTIEYDGKGRPLKKTQ